VDNAFCSSTIRDLVPDNMKFLPQLFAHNREWAAQQKQGDPQFFERLCAIQRPEYLWIGCADSRVPANTIVGLAPGEVFVHRNVANIVRPDDPNCLSVLQYAVDLLGISHVIVCGHYGCGGVRNALGPAAQQPLEGWLTPLRSLSRMHALELEELSDETARWNRLCELNVIEQVRVLAGLPTVTDAWQRGQRLVIHGWVYALHDGLLRDLKVSRDGLE
jgi:carbonic anhydrase